MVKGQLNAKRLEPFLKDDALAAPPAQQQPDLSRIDEADKVDEIVVTNVRLELVILYTDRDQCPEAHPLSRGLTMDMAVSIGLTIFFK